MATNVGKIGKMTYFPQAGISKRLAIWLFQFKHIQWQYRSYIVCKFGQDRSSNPWDC